MERKDIEHLISEMSKKRNKLFVIWCVLTLLFIISFYRMIMTPIPSWEMVGIVLVFMIYLTITGVLISTVTSISRLERMEQLFFIEETIMEEIVDMSRKDDEGNRGRIV